MIDSTITAVCVSLIEVDGVRKNSMRCFGIISDIHGETKKARKAYRKLKKFVDYFLVPGDLGDEYGEIVKVLSVFSQSKCPVYVMPGSHEPRRDWNRAIRQFQGSAIVDCHRSRRISFDEIDVLFVPGSDWCAHTGQFRLRPDKRFKVAKDEQGVFVTAATRLVRDRPTLLVSHVPPRFYKKGAIDRAQFGMATQDFIYVDQEGLRVIPKGAVFPKETASLLKRDGSPVKMLERNVGSKALRKLIRSQAIAFSVCGHIHEAGGKAVTLSGKRIRANTWHKRLYYNPGAVADGRAGVLVFRDGMMKYRNITV
ncbi:hypothetical protein GF342_04905 [Candidatus Woesearchaeota archaeon]|nr:hypothetical protein [Candidatus Woesearchaeota archaeon]